MNKINEFQTILKNLDIDAYIIPTSDFHMSEYTPAYFKTREYVSGFTGDAGTLLVTKNDAKLWTDGRFFLQASIELKDTPITLMKMGEPGVPTLVSYLQEILSNGGKLGFDFRVIDTTTALNIKKVLPNTEFVNVDLSEQIFENRPAMPFSYLYLLDKDFSGEDYESKLVKVRQMMQDVDADMLVLAKLEDQAWLYNLRADDIECTPVFLSFSVILNSMTYLFVDKEKINKDIQKYLDSKNIVVKDYNEIYSFLETVKDQNVMYDESSCNYSIYNSLSIGNNKLINKMNPTTVLKAIKNSTEIKNTRIAHVKDGVAMVKAMKYLYSHADELDEISYATYLEEKRKEQEGFIELSFETIAGFDKNGAIIHYSAKKGSEEKLNTTYPTFFLVDSGAHYCLGTTDITRTYALGDVTEDMKKDYTLVLKCHIDLALSKFKDGQTGEQIDMYARRPLWMEGLDYRHGTGHGVGHILSVHEGPQSFRNVNAKYPLKPGMITTDEPGLYRDGKWGIRIENEMLTVEDKTTEYGKFLKFETLTVCPYENKAINTSMLTAEELNWLNEYHANCYEKLSPFLNDEEKEFLKELTKQL